MFLRELGRYRATPLEGRKAVGLVQLAGLNEPIGTILCRLFQTTHQRWWPDSSAALPGFEYIVCA